MSILPSPKAHSGRTTLLREPLRLRTSIRSRILRHLLLLTGFTVMILSLISAIVGKSLIENRVLGQLTSTLAAHENFLSQSLTLNRERTGILAVQLERRIAALDGRVSAAFVRDAWKQLQDENVPVQGIAFFDLRGNVIERVGAAVAAPGVPPPGTRSQSVLNRRGQWVSTDVVTPVHLANEKPLGMLVVRYDASDLLARLSDNRVLGASNALTLFEADQNYVYPISITPSAPRQLSQSTLLRDFYLAEAFRGNVGLFAGKDEWGEKILAAYRTVPATRWVMLLQVDAADALAGWQQFVIVLLAVDIVLLLLTTVFGLGLSRQLSSPILQLSAKLSALDPEHWMFHRSVRTGDEVELLDAIAAELIARLQAAYGHLEELVEERTQELRKQYQLDSTILQQIEYGVFVTDASGTVITANPAAQQITQCAQGALIGRNAKDVLPFMRKALPLREQEHPVLRALRERKSVRFYHSDHIMLQVAAEELVPVSLVVTPLLTGSNVEGSILIVHDIREESKIDAMKSDFIALASHQLRTPLSALRWHLELLRDEQEPKLSEMQESCVQEIDHSSKRMAILLDDLLHVAHLEEGEIRAQKTAFDVTKMLEDLRAEWQPIVADHHLTCTFALLEHPVMLISDPVLLHLVLQNLFTNAVKYSSEGSEVKITCVEDGKNLVCTVTDKGMGIPPEEQSHVFEKFFRAKNVKKADTDGSGLGLYLSKMIMENLGGTIGFTSAPGAGTTFTITLPLG